MKKLTVHILQNDSFGSESVCVLDIQEEKRRWLPTLHEWAKDAWAQDDSGDSLDDHKERIEEEFEDSFGELDLKPDGSLYEWRARSSDTDVEDVIYDLIKSEIKPVQEWLRLHHSESLDHNLSQNKFLPQYMVI